MEVTTQNTATKTTSIEPGIQLINSIEQGNPKVEAFSQSIVFYACSKHWFLQTIKVIIDN